MNKTDKIFVAGGTGLAGSAIVRALLKAGFSNVVASCHTRKPDTGANGCRYIQMDLIEVDQVKAFFAAEQPQYIFLAAARVGGIMANHNYRAQFIYENLQIQNNIIHHSYLNKVNKLVFLGSTCIYPTHAPQPMQEQYLMTDTLEYLSEPYGVAKIAGIKMCESYNAQYGTNYISVMPTNLYGPNDNYDLQNSHFLPAFIRKMHLGKALMEDNWEAVRHDLNRNPVDSINGDATEEKIISLLKRYGITNDEAGGRITLWGTGQPRREVLQSDQLADACLFIMEQVNFDDLLKLSPVKYSDGIVKNEVRNTQINIGLGTDYTLFEIAMLVKKAVNYTGEIIWDRSMPDGTMQKLTAVDRLTSLGWKNQLTLEEGIDLTYTSYKNNSA